MIIPNSLQEGDKIYILSTARKISMDEIEPAISLLKKWKLQPVIGNTIGIEDNQMAGSDTQRTADFQNAMDNPDIKAIWCARGGYGTVRIIDQLDFKSYLLSPKWVIGYSDVTVLHNHLNAHGIVSVHATMPINIDKNSETALESLREICFRQSVTIQLPNVDKMIKQKIKAPIIGGNLSIIYSLLGSPSSLNTDGKILFIEDLDEYLYHIDRMMMNLKRNGYLSKLKALIVGGMTRMHDNTIPFGKTAREIILDITVEYDYPVLFDFPAGHLDDNRAIAMGMNMEITIDSENCTFKQ